MGDNNNNNWRGRGRGRGNHGGGGGGGGGFQSNSRDYDNFDYKSNAYNNNNPSNISITSRLGPTNVPINNRTVTHSPRSSHNEQSRGGGRAFSSNNYRGRGNRGGGRGGQFGGGGARFNEEFVDEDTDMKAGSMGANVVTVSGYPPGSEEKVLGFLNRKAKTAWEPLSVQYEQKSMHITVIDEITADGLCRMNNYNFGAATLHITRRGGGQSKDGGVSNRLGGFSDNRGGSSNNRNTNTSSNSRNNNGRSAVLADFLQERWNPQAGFLDMDELPPTSHNITTVISRLLNEAKYLFGDSLVTISFARNKLWSVVPLTKVPEMFPNLQNLSIADNDIAEFRSLDKLANKFPNLQELMLSGNPIQVNNPVDKYQKEVLNRFPTIRFLDVHPVGGTGGDAVQQTELPLPVRSHFFDQDSSRIAAQDLLSKYFPLFDSNRSSLTDLYDAQAVFSCVFSKGTYQQQNAWGSSQVAPSQRMVFGNEHIVKRLDQLPGTSHDLSRADKFMTDAWQTPGSQNYPVVLFLTVHGEFAETPVGTPLSFDRTFLVAPSSPGSRAHTAGWSYVILSDSLVVRDYSCKPGSLVAA